MGVSGGIALTSQGKVSGQIPCRSLGFLWNYWLGRDLRIMGDVGAQLIVLVGVHP
jgi:hypothetical protein